MHHHAWRGGLHGGEEVLTKQTVRLLVYAAGVVIGASWLGDQVQFRDDGHLVAIDARYIVGSVEAPSRGATAQPPQVALLCLLINARV